MKWWTGVGVVAVILIAAVVCVVLRPGSEPDTRPASSDQTKSVPQQPTFLLTGTASCSARGCHGSLTPPAHLPPKDAVQFDEYTRWNGQDPHTRTFQVLFEDRSKEIAKNLKSEAPPHKDKRCLACHVNPLAVGAAAEQFLHEARNSPAAQQLWSERLVGVGCESCHGPAEHWLGPHTTAAWKTATTADKKKQGMWPVGDVAVRGKVCAGCHVGAPPEKNSPLRDVNHDLIAAGHPRLQFELGTFLANLPPHWNVEAKKAPDAEAKKAQDAQTWALGQVVSAEAALKLLAYRAAPAPKDDTPWPEFAEYDCFACHHHLQPDSWRQRANHLGKRKPGTLPWGSWYFALAGKLGTPAVVEKLESLTASMEKPYPSRPTVKQQAQEALTKLAALRKQIAEKPFKHKALRELLLAVKQDGQQCVANWDVAEQLYLAAHALRPPPAGEPVHQLRAFPFCFDSPRGFRPDLFLEALKLD